jgi:putative sterol carrier protein
MATFQSSEEVYDVLGTFLDEITKAPDLKAKFVNANTSFLVTQTDPESRILVDCTVDPPRVINDPGPDDDGEIHMFMSSDDAHKFWQGKLNATIALAKKQIKVQGPLSKLMKLLPAMQPAFGRYRTFLEERGHADKLL